MTLSVSDAIITVEDLGKKYSIRHERERYTALRDVIANRAKSLFRRSGKGRTTRPLATRPRDDETTQKAEKLTH
jgi:hypothetical protein